MSKLVSTNAVHIKNCDTVVYATDAQVYKLSVMRNDPDKRYNFIKLGSITFSPMDVSYIEQKQRESYDLPKYFLERKEREDSSLIQIK